VSGGRVHLFVPGPLDQRTGGYLYDARMAAGLRTRGWAVEVHELPGRFPDPDRVARAALEEGLAGVPPDALAVLDGLAAALLPEVVEAAARRTRVLALVHHPLAEETGLAPEEAERFRARERRTLAACAGVIVTSPFTAERLVSWGVPTERIRVAVPGTEAAPAAEGPPAGTPPRLVTVGSLVPRKGHDILVEALTRIRDLPWSACWAGSPDRDRGFAGEVRTALRRARLGDRIELAGEVDAPALDRIYHGASLFVLPSRYEGYGMAFTEALARGLPVVATTGGAIPHTVPPDAGVLVPPGDVDALAEALRTLLLDEDRRASLARAARAHAGRLPDWAEACDGFAGTLRELGGKPAGAGTAGRSGRAGETARGASGGEG
jgi:glycosyltransferase involved in cell wall biosynthesis